MFDKPASPGDCLPCLFPSQGFLDLLEEFLGLRSQPVMAIVIGLVVMMSCWPTILSAGGRRAVEARLGDIGVLAFHPDDIGGTSSSYVRGSLTRSSFNAKG